MGGGSSAEHRQPNRYASKEAGRGQWCSGTGGEPSSAGGVPLLLNCADAVALLDIDAFGDPFMDDPRLSLAWPFALALAGAAPRSFASAAASTAARAALDGATAWTKRHSSPKWQIAFEPA